MKKVSLFLVAAMAIGLLASCKVDANPVDNGDQPIDNGGNPSVSVPDAPATGKVFKSFDGEYGIQIWDGSFEVFPDTGLFKVKAYGGWWGGAFGGYDQFGANIIKAYDMSDVAYVTFTLDITEDLNPGLYVRFGEDFPGDKDRNKYEFTAAERSAGKHDIKFTLKGKLADPQGMIFLIGGGSDSGVDFSLTNLAFWNENDQEIKAFTISNR